MEGGGGVPTLGVGEVDAVEEDGVGLDVDVAGQPVGEVDVQQEEVLAVGRGVVALGFERGNDREAVEVEVVGVGREVDHAEAVGLGPADGDLAPVRPEIAVAVAQRPVELEVGGEVGHVAGLQDHILGGAVLVAGRDIAEGRVDDDVIVVGAEDIGPGEALVKLDAGVETVDPGIGDRHVEDVRAQLDRDAPAAAQDVRVAAHQVEARQHVMAGIGQIRALAHLPGGEVLEYGMDVVRLDRIGLQHVEPVPGGEDLVAGEAQDRVDRIA